jgi:hypothetical protein
MKTEKTVRKDKTGKRGASPHPLFLICFIFYLVSCEQPGGNSGIDLGGREAQPEQGEQPGDTPYELPEAEEGYVPQIVGVVISAYPDTTYFAKGQEFSYAGLVLRFVYDNNEYGRALSSGEYAVETVDTTALAPSNGVRPKLVTVAISPMAEGVFPAVKFNITIDSSTSILTDIKMANPPSKTVYTAGEEFSSAGATVTGLYQGGDRHGETVTVSGAVVAADYNGYRRGVQTVTLKLNGTAVGTVSVTVKLPANTAITVNKVTGAQNNDKQTEFYKPVRLKNAPLDLAHFNIRATATVGGRTLLMTYDNGGITEADVSGYNFSVPGLQTLTLSLDGNTRTFKVYVADVEPAVWFDYGYRRTAQDPGGAGPGEGAYYAKPGETLVLSPVRFLIGYEPDPNYLPNYIDSGASYSWSVSGPGTYSKTSSGNGGEFCYFTPSAAGNYTVQVSVTGKSVVTGAASRRTPQRRWSATRSRWRSPLERPTRTRPSTLPPASTTKGRGGAGASAWPWATRCGTSPAARTIRWLSPATALAAGPRRGSSGCSTTPTATAIPTRRGMN